MIVPKYDVGDRPWVGDWDVVEERVTCPDCLGEREVAVTTPAGEVFKAPCRHCYHGWESRGYLVVRRYAPKVWRGTVGSVRIDTNDDNPVSYMLEETGVGSGTIHYEKRLFDDVEDARAYGAAEAAKQEAHIASQNAKRLKEMRASEMRYEERWRRHSKALCEAVAGLCKKVGSADPDMAKTVRRVERLLGWIKPEEY